MNSVLINGKNARNRRINKQLRKKTCFSKLKELPKIFQQSLRQAGAELGQTK